MIDVRALATKISEYIDGWKVHLVNITAFLVVLLKDWGHWDATSFALMGLTALSSLFKMMAWKPGPLSGAVMLKQPDGGTLVVKPPPPREGS